MTYNRTKIYKIYGLCIKTAIIVVAFWFIYRRLFVKDDLDNSILQFEENFSEPSFIKGLILVIVLMFTNWAIETFKWKFLINKIEKVSFFSAMVAVFSGMTVSIFTPNRVGEYAGRVFILEKANRWEGVLITMLGSMSQLMVTVLCGLISFVFFALEYDVLSGYPVYYFYGLTFIISVIVIVILLLFFKISWLTKLIGRLPKVLNKIKPYGKIFSLYTAKELFYLLLFSIARYIIFTSQFYLLLMLFKVDMPYYHALMMISLIYLSIAIFPTYFLTELGVRVSASLYFIGMYFEQFSLPVKNDNIMIASSLLWLINLAIPALIGAVFVFRLKFFRKE